MSNIYVSVFLYVNTMPVDPVDSLLIYVDLKGRRICPLVLGRILLIVYDTTLSKAVFDFCETRALTVSHGYPLASQELRIELVEVAHGGKWRWREQVLRNRWTSTFTDLKII